MRVLMLATRVPVHAGDGTPSFVLDQATGLRGRADVLLLCPRVKGSVRHSVHDGVELIRFPYLPPRWERIADDAVMPQLGQNPLLWIQAVALVIGMTLAAFRAHRQFRPDLIHAHWIVPAGSIARFVGGVLRTPYVLTSHGADAFLLERWPLEHFKRMAVRRSARFIAVSREIHTKYGSLAPQSDVQPVGVDFSLWMQLTGSRAPERDQIVFVGRLVPKKGVDIAIRALAELPVAALRIIGDGPLRADLEALVSELDLGQRVTFLGSLSRAEVAAEFRTATCIVIPSVRAPDGDRDGTPTVLGESVAAGVPCIASDIAGLRDHVEDGMTGLLVPQGDVSALRTAMARLLGDPELCVRLSVTARDRLVDRFDLHATSARHAEWYSAAISASEATPRRTILLRNRISS